MRRNFTAREMQARAFGCAVYYIRVALCCNLTIYICKCIPARPRHPQLLSHLERESPPDGHIKFLIKRWIDRNKWKDAVFEPAERLEEKSVSAFQYSQVVSRAFCPRITSPSSGLFSSAVPLSTEIRKRQDLFRRKVIRVIKLISGDLH